VFDDGCRLLRADVTYTCGVCFVARNDADGDRLVGGAASAIGLERRVDAAAVERDGEVLGDGDVLVAVVTVRVEPVFARDEPGVLEVVEPAIRSRSRDAGHVGDGTTPTGALGYGLEDASGVRVTEEVEEGLGRRR
jgi:hypothetical protein